MLFKSLKHEMLFFTLGLTILTIFLTTVLNVNSTKTTGKSLENTTSDVLREQAEEFLVQLAVASAKNQDLVFDKVADVGVSLAAYTKNIYENPSFFSKGYWIFDDRVFQKNGKYLNRETDISTIHIPDFVTLDSREKRKIELTANLDFVAPGFLASNNNIAAIYTIDEKGVTRYFPNIVLGNLGPPDYDPREDVYYKPATPKENPNKKVLWSELYEDAAGRGLMITNISPIYTKVGFEGIVGIDIFLNSIIKNIEVYNPIQGAYAFLIDKEGNVIAFPDKAYKDILGREREKDEGQISLLNATAEVGTILDGMVSGVQGFGSIHRGPQELFIAYAPLPQTGFSLAIVAEEKAMLQVVRNLQAGVSNSIRETIFFKVLPLSILIIILTSFAGIWFVSQITKPVKYLIRGAQEIGGGNLAHTIYVNSRNEVGTLADTFNKMGAKLKQSREKLAMHNKKLAGLNRRLQELDIQKTEFINIAAHQLRTPTSIINNYLAMIQDGDYGPVSKELNEVISNMETNNQWLVHLAEKLLYLTKLEQGDIKYNFAEHDINDIIEQAVIELDPLAKKQGISIIWTKKLPIVGLFDEEKMRNVLFNLLDNAIRYSNDGGKVVIFATIEKEAIIVKIIDQGIGFTQDDKNKFFKKFQRGRNAQGINVHQSTGLGLYFVKKFVEGHNGRVWAKSAGIGRGSEFGFWVAEAINS